MIKKAEQLAKEHSLEDLKKLRDKATNERDILVANKNPDDLKWEAENGEKERTLNNMIVLYGIAINLREKEEAGKSSSTGGNNSGGVDSDWAKNYKDPYIKSSGVDTMPDSQKAEFYTGKESGNFAFVLFTGIDHNNNEYQYKYTRTEKGDFVLYEKKQGSYVNGGDIYVFENINERTGKLMSYAVYTKKGDDVITLIDNISAEDREKYFSTVKIGGKRSYK